MKIQFIDHNGAKIGVFWDINNAECSFQADKVQETEVLWLGVNIDMQGKPAFRMCLDKKQIAVINEILKQFLDTGKTPTNPEEMPQSIKINENIIKNEQ